MRGGPFGKGCLDPEATWDRNGEFLTVRFVASDVTRGFLVHAKGEL